MVEMGQQETMLIVAHFEIVHQESAAAAAAAAAFGAVDAG
jgi:hypothetical protein